MRHIPVVPVSAKLWRDAFGPGYAVGPGGRLVEMLGKKSGKGYRSVR